MASDRPKPLSAPWVEPTPADRLTSIVNHTMRGDAPITPSHGVATSTRNPRKRAIGAYFDKPTIAGDDQPKSLPTINQRHECPIADRFGLASTAGLSYQWEAKLRRSTRTSLTSEINARHMQCGIRTYLQHECWSSTTRTRRRLRRCEHLPFEAATDHALSDERK